MYDVIIVGSGLAGMTTALSLPQHYRIALMSKTPSEISASDLAQGGIAAAMDFPTDSVEQHVQDTFIAGDGLCDEESTRQILSDGKSAIEWLAFCGVNFTPDQHSVNGLHLTREGGHQCRRIAHVKDFTGHAIIEKLWSRVQNAANIDIKKEFLVIDLLQQADGQCVGVTGYQQGKPCALHAKYVVLASGGLGQIYANTCNPVIATADGFAMAARAGAILSNLEFVQFHPTCLKQANCPAFLISEAVRGEGGLLLNPITRQRFMPNYDDRAELAPRDIVSRAITQEMRHCGENHVLLDISYKGKSFVEQYFPKIAQTCLSYGLDITQEPIPVAPGAHYSCGGVLTDLHGHATVPHLYVVGESACTGLQGANRLASNSLLECVVMGRRAALDIRGNLSMPQKWVCQAQLKAPIQKITNEHVKQIRQNAEMATDIRQEAIRSQLQALMWQKLGIIRNNEDMQQAYQQILELSQSVHPDQIPMNDQSWVELRNLLIMSLLICQSAMNRHESRGAHANRDYPKRLAQAIPSYIQIS